MSNQVILYFLGIAVGLFVLIVIAYVILQKRMNKSDINRIKKLREGANERAYSNEVLYQKLYITYSKIPFLKSYLKRIRRKLEVINVDSEYLTRRQAAQIITRAALIVIPLTIVIIAMTHQDFLLMSILLIFEVFIIETIMEGMVEKLDTKLLKQQIDFFAEIRHAYHEYNMVEEAIYEASQNDELEVSRQGEKIYEILISDDPETELETYYDVAPNSYLKEFAGISYLTREFGDRTDENGASLYLKNLNNITEEMQIEILKRDKLNYVFQSLSVISILPALFIRPIRNWAVSNFSFTTKFYDGKLGLIAQVVLLILTFICYILTRKIKNTSTVKDEYKDPNRVWQMKAYKIPLIKQITDAIIPKKNSKEYIKTINLMKEAATKQKIETLYINRICVCIITFLASLFLLGQLHKVAIDYVYDQPTTTSDYNILGSLSAQDEQKAMEKTAEDNYFLDKFKGKTKVTEEQIKQELKVSEYYRDEPEESIEKAAARIYNKLKIVNSEYLKWFEWILAFIFAIGGYMGPKLMLVFQKMLRQLEIENEIMQFQTIIIMLMKIERVNVEIILEWLERYANIFKEPISKCVNNYEAGAWEALEELKNEIRAKQLIRIVESLQSAVERIPIQEAFDELDNEREYYQEKRKEANEKLISRKGLLGKVIGFAPMITLFVAYLIIPLMVIGLTSMTSGFETMGTMIN